MELFIRKREAWILLIALGLYGLNKYCLGEILTLHFMSSYFNDIMGGIVFGVMVRWAGRFWLKREIPAAPTLLLTLAAGVYWEVIAPLYIRKSVRDLGDIAAYLSGGACLLLLMKITGGKDEV